MMCPTCDSKAAVKNIKTVGGVTYRFLQCKVCKFRFYTAESVIDYDTGYNKFSEWYKNDYEKKKSKRNGADQISQRYYEDKSD